MSKAVVTAQAPLRISFAGGGTDIAPYADDYGGIVVSATIARYVTVRATLGDNPPQFASYPVDETDTPYLQKVAQHSKEATSLEARVDVAPRSGLGASGALGVACFACLGILRGEPIEPKVIAEQAYQFETRQLAVAGGRQDQYAAACGGIKVYYFSKDGVKVESVSLPLATLRALQSSILMVFIHPRVGTSSQIMADEMEQAKRKDKAILETLNEQKSLASQALVALERGDIKALGEIIDASWQVRKRQSPQVTNDVIEAVSSLAKKAGALGAKLAGAGGGGYMFIITPGKEGPVAEALRSIGLRPENVVFDPLGVRTW